MYPAPALAGAARHSVPSRCRSSGACRAPGCTRWTTASSSPWSSTDDGAARPGRRIRDSRRPGVDGDAAGGRPRRPARRHRRTSEVEREPDHPRPSHRAHRAVAGALRGVLPRRPRLRGGVLVEPPCAVHRELVGYPTVDLHAAILRIPGSDVFLELLEYRDVDADPSTAATPTRAPRTSPSPSTTSTGCTPSSRRRGSPASRRRSRRRSVRTRAAGRCT